MNERDFEVQRVMALSRLHAIAALLAAAQPDEAPGLSRLLRGECERAGEVFQAACKRPLPGPWQ